MIVKTVHWCWTCNEPSTISCRDLEHDVRRHQQPTGDPAVELWHESMAASTSAQLRAAQGALAASQADLTRVERELADAKHEWALDVDALITARQEIERRDRRIEELEDQLKERSTDA